MAKRRGRFLRLLLALIIIVAAGALAAPYVPLPPLKSAAQDGLSETFGRRISVDSARVSVIDGPALLLKGVTAEEDPAFGSGMFFKAEDVRAGIDTSQYLKTRRLAINSLTLKSAEISLVRNVDGTWNWTTLGGRGLQQPTAGSTRSRLAGSRITAIVEAVAEKSTIVPITAMTAITETLIPMLESLISIEPGEQKTLRRVTLENASIRLMDRSSSSPLEVLYRNIALDASLEPQSSPDGRAGTRVKGDLVVHSSGDDGRVGTLNVDLPFDLFIRDSTPLDVGGSIGPGPFDTGNLIIDRFELTGDLQAERGRPLTAKGQLTGGGMFIGTINVSEQVGRAVRVDQIGDMNPGTSIANLQADFKIEQGTIHTSILRIQQLDGLGDARADNGSFSVDSTLTVNYAAIVTLSPDATARIKSAGPMLGLLATLLEYNNRLSVPISISGDLRKPQVRVDVSRIF